MKRRPQFNHTVARGFAEMLGREDLAWLFNSKGGGLRGRKRRDIKRAVKYMERMVEWDRRPR